MSFPITSFIEAAMECATYDKLEDGTFAGEIDGLPGVAAFGATLRACEQELRSTLEDWLLIGLRLGHKIPKIAALVFSC
jgi:predicted RNase H-like HicB family nuclease